MRVVDTSIWIEWVIGGTLHKKLMHEFPDRTQCVVPTIVQLELSKWLTREFGEDKSDQVIAFTQVCQVIPLDTEIALAAAEACRAHRLATADAIIFATARLRGATLLTCDAHFEGLPGVTLIGKAST